MNTGIRTEYTEAEREEMLRKMRVASSTFYGLAANAGCHAFIEFTGLMNEYIKLCEEAHKRGIDFTLASIHTGRALPIEPHHIAYLGEKLACIYGASLDDAGRRQLLEALG